MKNANQINNGGFENVRSLAVSVMDCRRGQKPNNKSTLGVWLTLGYADGAINRLWLSSDDGRKLLHMLSVELRFENKPYGAATHGGLVKRWLVRHSIMRSKLNLDFNRNSVLADIRNEMPEVAEYIDLQLSYVRKATRRVLEPRAVNTLISRLGKAMLVIVDATAN